jgi:hypothetical protein
LTNVTLPNRLTSITDLMFYDCTSLSSIRIPDTVTRIGRLAFYNCRSLTNVTVPDSVSTIGTNAFDSCTSLTGVYFRGDAPSVGYNVFNADNKLTVYYLPGTTGWDTWVAPPPAVLWNPQPQSIGVQTNQIGFTIIGTADIPMAVVASTNHASGSWTTLQSCTLTNGSIYFSDPQWTNYPVRLYRIRSP